MQRGRSDGRNAKAVAFVTPTRRAVGAGDPAGHAAPGTAHRASQCQHHASQEPVHADWLVHAASRCACFACFASRLLALRLLCLSAWMLHGCQRACRMAVATASVIGASLAGGARDMRLLVVQHPCLYCRACALVVQSFATFHMFLGPSHRCTGCKGAGGACFRRTGCEARNQCNARHCCNIRVPDR